MTRKTSGGPSQGGYGMEPPDLDTGEGSGNGSEPASGARPFPSVPKIRAAQLSLSSETEKWLATCRRLCELRLPSEVFKSIPEDLFRIAIWGTRVIVKRAPKVDQTGMLVIPENAQSDNAHGWVINVGPDICWDQTPDNIVRGKTCPYGGLGAHSPLLLVGEMVFFNPFAGREVGALKETIRGRGKREYVLTSIADIWGPIPTPNPEDWATKLDVPESRIIS